MAQNLNIRGERVLLRGVEPRDIDLMYGVENDLSNWAVSGSTQPFSRYLLEQFIDTQRSDIYVSRQLRLMIESFDGDVVGIVDLFEYDPYNHRAGVGIVILGEYRRLGYGADALSTLSGYGREVLQLHQLWCGVAVDNLASRNLFAKVGYCEAGVKRDWLWRVDGYVDEVVMQRLL